ncbi:transketolase [Streptomyces sp. BBFR51]|uniref:transketolase n=1 Tax=Streptomyces sp. BBFR51 TaxID=3372856 RepID=UPI0037DC9516
MGAPTILAEDVYREELARAGAQDGRVVCVEALPTRVRHPFETAHPDRFFQLGSVESATLTMVEGLVTAGFRVFVCGVGLEAGVRAARLPRLSTSCLAAGASVVVPDTQADPADLLRTPRVQIAVPSGVREIRGVVRGAVRSGRPHHIRLGSAAPVDVSADWAGADDGDIPSVVWGADRARGGADTQVCLVSVGEHGARLAVAVQERFAGAAHARLVYLDDSHLTAASGELARRCNRFVVLGGHQGPYGVRSRLSRLMPGCDVRAFPVCAEAASDVDRVLSLLEGLRS